MQDALAVFPALVELTYREGSSSFLLFLFLSGNFPRSLGLFLQTVQNVDYCTSLRGKTCFSVFFFFSFSLHIGLFSLALKDLDNIPLQIFPKSTMSFLKPSPLTEENTVPAGG